MKIKVTQLDEQTRDTIALALEMYVNYVYELLPNVKKQYKDIGHTIRHGEVLLCEYQYNEQEEGGEHGV